MAPMSIRLDPKTERLLSRLARTRRATRSAVIREAISTLAARSDANETPFEKMADLVGSVAGGPKDLSRATGDRLRQALKTRAARR